MRRAAVDANQSAVVLGLRTVGVAVMHLHRVGQGCPDIAAAYDARANFFFEIKDPDKPPSARKLTPAQVKWHAAWPGPVFIIHTWQEALARMGLSHLAGK